MGMTLAEKILARASGREAVTPDEIVVARVDLAMSHENADLVRKSFLEIGAPQVWDPSKIVIIFDHRVPAESEKTATTHKAVREFAAAQGIQHFYDVGRGGICHQVLPENGHVRPGMVLVGTDSHTTTHGAFGAFATGIGATEMAGVWTEGTLWFKVPATLRIEVEGEFRPWISAKDLILYIIGRLGAAGADYRAVEFDGPAIRRMTVASRMVLANLSMEMGAKVAFTPVDETLLDWLRPRDAGAAGEDRAGCGRALRAGAAHRCGRGPAGAADRLPARRGQREAALGVGRSPGAAGGAWDRAPTGGWRTWRSRRASWQGAQVHPRTRLVVIPASQQIYRDAMRLGYLDTLVAAGGMIAPPGCGPCVGVHQGILAAGETCVSSTNRNFLGRMGSKDSKVYLASPAVVAASAVAGRLEHPGSIVKESEPCLVEA